MQSIKHKAFNAVDYYFNGGRNSAINRNILISKVVLQARQRGMGKITFVSIKEMADAAAKLADKIPQNFDIIVGIPRCGWIPAAIIALKHAKPLTTPDLLLQGKAYLGNKEIVCSSNQNILLVDDMVARVDGTFKKHFYSIKSKFPNIKRASVYMKNDAGEAVDYCQQLVPNTTLFEWDLRHNNNMGLRISSDMDGVICEDCPSEVDSNEEKYVEWIKNAKPLLIPEYEFNSIISCRLEKYRGLTEQWLKEHKVRYKRLILWKLDNKKGRDSNGFIHHKISSLLIEKPYLYFENDYKIAIEIWKATKIPILLTEDKILLQ